MGRRDDDVPGRILDLLGDGGFHSGAGLARMLGISRAAVWQAVQRLRARGIDVEAVRGRGYRLPNVVDWLDAQTICGALAESVMAILGPLEVLRQVDSTSSELARRMNAGWPSGSVLLAEQQTAGRGRQGRPWQSPFGASLYLSVGAVFALPLVRLGALSLVAGVAVARALEGLGVAGVELKWPNDLMHRGRKLGGILLEVSGESGGPARVITGIGINVHMPGASARRIDQPWTDLATAAGTAAPGRNRLAAAVLNELLPLYGRFAERGVGQIADDWARYDWLAGREVRVLAGDRQVEGVARGVDDSGALMVRTGQGLQRFLAGEVSVRRSR